MSKWTLLAVTFLISALLLGCDEAAETAGNATLPDWAGTYAMVSINGDALPATIVDESGPGCDQSISSGSMELRADGTFTASVTGEDVRRTNETEACDENFDVTDTGTFEVSGQSIVFTAFFEAAPPIEGTLSDDAVSVTIPGEVVAIEMRFEK